MFVIFIAIKVLFCDKVVSFCFSGSSISHCLQYFSFIKWLPMLPRVMADNLKRTGLNFSICIKRRHWQYKTEAVAFSVRWVGKKHLTWLKSSHLSRGYLQCIATQQLVWHISACMVLKHGCKMITIERELLPDSEVVATKAGIWNWCLTSEVFCQTRLRLCWKLISSHCLHVGRKWEHEVYKKEIQHQTRN